MNRLICCVLCFAFCSAAFSQRIYFVYIQSESEQPFFVKIGEQTQSSAPAGYLVLSQLKDSSYRIKVGFPQNKWPDQQFTIEVKSKDHGYLLKNFGEKGWGLFDLQTMSIQMATGNNIGSAQKEMRQVSAFTAILSKAANDPSLMEKPVFAVAKTEQKPENVSPVVVKEESNSAKQPVSEPKIVPKAEDKITTDIPAVVTTQGKDVVKELPDSNTKLLEKEAAPPVAKTEVEKKDTKPAVTDSQATTSVKVQQDSSAGSMVKKTDTVIAKTDVEENKTKPAVTDSQVTASVKVQQDSSAGSLVKKTDTAIAKTAAEESKTKPAVTDSQSIAAVKARPDSSVKSLEKKKDPPVVKTVVEKKETKPVAADSQAEVTSQAESKAGPVEYYKKTIVVKKAENSTTEGLGLTFIDHHPDGQKDTIQIFISRTNESLTSENGQQVNEKKFLNISDEESKPLVSKATGKNNCSTIGSQNDFLKLRKKMAGQKTEEAMIEEAKKEFKVKCYTTEQIKHLGNLFLNEAGKFQFYEAVYPFSSDRDNFTDLQAELKDNYFIHRFKNLVKPGSL